jgi:RND family efflux transporter MFP subunit
VRAQFEPQREDLALAESVTWINRERSGGSGPDGAPSSGDSALAPATEATPDIVVEPVEDAQGEPAGLAGIPRRWISLGIGAGVALIALLVALGYYHRAALAPQTAEGSIPLVSARVPGLTPVTSTVTFTGTINARYDMPIGTEGETGRISAVYVEAGDHVRNGQLLARLDDAVLRPQVDRLAAALEQEHANASLAEAEWKRAQGVEASGALSAEDIEKRRATAVTAAAQVRVAAAQLAEYQARLAHTEIRAPADGLVLTRAAEVGQIATPGGTALFRLARGGEVEMRGQVAEQDLPSLSVEQPATVRLTGSDRSFSGKVRLLGAVIDPQTRLGEIRVALAPDPLLRPGAFARAEVVVGGGRRAVLPQTAVLSDDQGAFVYVVVAEGRIERRAVRVADTTEKGIVIGAGLTGREQVVITAAAFLRPGERVSVADEPAP